MRFWNTMEREAARLLYNNEVYLPSFLADLVDGLDYRQSRNLFGALKREHCLKIQNTDAIYVINDLFHNKPYVGECTEYEIKVAQRANKLIFHYKEMDGYKYLCTCDGMHLVIPENYVIQDIDIHKLSGIQKVNTNGVVVKIPLNTREMNKLDIDDYMGYISTNERLHKLMKTGELLCELGMKSVTDPIEKRLSINPANVVGTILAFTTSAIYVRFKDSLVDKLSMVYENISDLVATPRTFGYFNNTSGKFKIHSIVTWDLDLKTS